MEETEQLTEIQQLEGAFEAILFAAGHPMEYSVIGEALSMTKRDARTMAEHIAEKYNRDENGGIMMLLFPDSCQLCTRETYLPYIRIALGIKRGGTISPSAMETLAIVAYNQPVTRAFVDTVRGVDSSYAVTSLTEKGLIDVCGRLDAPGRPMLYGTTDKFLRVFGFESLDDLPEAGSVEAAMADLTAPREEEDADIPIEIPPKSPEDAEETDSQSEENK